MKTLISNQRLRLSHVLTGVVAIAVFLWSGSVIYTHFHYSKPVTPANQSQTVAPVEAGTGSLDQAEEQAVPDTQPASNVSQPVSAPKTTSSTPKTSTTTNTAQTGSEQSTPLTSEEARQQPSWAAGPEPSADQSGGAGGGGQ